jgi:3-phenylpropionate/trans-cinnamate dioxygenase ferredoxin reductase subunit
VSVGRLDRVVVVGNGIAGLTAADSLRNAGFDGELTIVGDERHAPYSRPALSKAALVDDGEMASHLLPAPDHGAVEILGASAARLDAVRKIVHLADGTGLPYDAVFVATGSRARRLGGGSGVEEHTLRTLDDALALRRRLADRPSVVVLGGGALGMEIASGCRALGCETTIVSNGAPLAAHLGGHLSGVVLESALRGGLRVVASRAAELRDAGGHAGVVLADGSTIEAEVVVSAVGDLPNLQWLATSGLLTNGALEADRRGRVGPGVFAAGDVATFPTRRGPTRVPLWTSAIEQSRAAALALVRGEEAPELDFLPYFWTEQFGHTLKASGFLPLAGEPEVVDGDPGGGSSLLRWTHDDGTGTAVALNYRIAIPRLRKIGQALPAAAP